ncbi:MAG: BMP family ABC transporter substrate-binding protein [Myxococcales bacterium]|nr:BMP family ABC transporter substrate-binding protein [Myxococcales bacterium]MDP3500794.1 BMP family ABC transporter substrate-binding protein [Myxococcales bacterium]
MRHALLVVLLACGGCKKSSDTKEPKSDVKPKAGLMVGLVTDIGGRGDQSFNDSALRGLEVWAASSSFKGGSYETMPAAARDALIPADLKARITPVALKPLVVQSKVQEDYQPNLQLVVDQGANLIVGVGFALENAVETVAKQNPDAKFLLIDSPILDAKGAPQSLPNVRTVVFKEQEGSFLVGALAGLVAKDKLGFVGGMEIPLIKKFEAGFRAGAKTTNPKAQVLVQYTGTFDNVQHGKQAAADLVAKGCEVVFHAAGSDGSGVIQAVKEARAGGKAVFVIGVDSDQSHLAPEAVLTSMVKRVDLAVWQAIKDLEGAKFSAGDSVMGLKEGGVTFAEVTLDFPGKAEALAKVKSLEAAIIAGSIVVPANEKDLESFVAPAN